MSHDLFAVEELQSRIDDHGNDDPVEESPEDRQAENDKEDRDGGSFDDGLRAISLVPPAGDQSHVANSLLEQSTPGDVATPTKQGQREKEFAKGKQEETSTTDEGGLITLRTPGGAKVAEFQTDGDTFEGIGDLSTKTAGTKSSITQFTTSEEKAVAWAKSMGYPVPTKMNGCATGLLVAVGLLAAIVPGILLLVWLGVQGNQYKRDMAALVAKWVDAGKPEPGEGSKEVTKLERVVEKVETPSASADSIEQKLMELNSMKGKGLITEEEYQAMRKKALGL